MWENSLYVSRQLTGIGPAFASLLVSSGKTSFDIIRQSNPRDLERIINKGPPAGNNIIKQVILLPLYVINLQLEQNRMLHLSVSINNYDEFKDNISTTGITHKLSLIVGDSENNLLLFTIVQDKHLFNMPNATINRKIHLKLLSAHTVFAHCISNNWVGIDVIATINVKESHSKVIPSPLQRDIRDFISKSFMDKNGNKSNSINNGFNDELYDFLFDDVIEESQNNDKKPKKRVTDKLNVRKNKKSKKINNEIQETDADKTLINDLSFSCNSNQNEEINSINLCETTHIQLEDNKRALSVETPNRAKKIQKTLSSLWKNKKNVFEHEYDNQIIEEFSESEFMSSFNSEPIELEKSDHEDYNFVEEHIDDNDKNSVCIENIIELSEDNINEKISQEMNKLEQLRNDSVENQTIELNEEINKVEQSSMDLVANQFIDDNSLNDLISQEINKLEESSKDLNTYESQLMVDTNFNDLISHEINKLKQSNKDVMNQSQECIDINSEEIYELEQTDLNSIANHSQEYITEISQYLVEEIGEKIDHSNQNSDMVNNSHKIEEINTNSRSSVLNEIDKNIVDFINNGSIKWSDPLIVDDNVKSTRNLGDLHTNVDSKTNKAIQVNDDLIWKNFALLDNMEETPENNKSIIQNIYNQNYVSSINIKTSEGLDDNDDVIWKDCPLLDNLDFDEILPEINKRQSNTEKIKSKFRFKQNHVLNANFESSEIKKNNNDASLFENLIFDNDLSKKSNKQGSNTMTEVSNLSVPLNDGKQPRSIKNDIQRTLFKHSKIYKNNLNILQSKVDDSAGLSEEPQTADVIIKASKKRPSICNIFTYNNENDIAKYYLDENIQDCNDHIVEENVDEEVGIETNTSSPEVILLDKELQGNILDPQWVLTNAYKNYQSSNKSELNESKFDKSTTDRFNVSNSYKSKYKSKLDEFKFGRSTRRLNDMSDSEIDNVLSLPFDNEAIVLNGSQYSRFSDRYSQMTRSYTLGIESPSSSQPFTIDSIRQFSKTPKNKLKPMKRMRYS